QTGCQAATAHGVEDYVALSLGLRQFQETLFASQVVRKCRPVIQLNSRRCATSPPRAYQSEIFFPHHEVSSQFLSRKTMLSDEGLDPRHGNAQLVRCLGRGQ